MFVGSDWDEGHDYRYTGLRNVILEAFAGEGCQQTRMLSNGREVMDTCLDQTYSVDSEAAYWILYHEIDYLIETYHNSEYNYSAGYNYYCQVGAIALAKGRHSSSIDNILRRTAFKQRHGLCGENYNREDLLRKTISKKEMTSLLSNIDSHENEKQEAVQLFLFQEAA